MRDRIDADTQNALSMIRIVATIFIFVCHVFRMSDNVLINKLYYVFNMGVQIFFILSGYSFSIKDEPTNYFFWFTRRFLRVLLPYYLFLMLYYIALKIVNGEIITHAWVTNIFLLQGIKEDYTNGAGHLWYITYIVICYLVTPLFFTIKKQMDKCRYPIIMFSFVSILMFSISLFIPPIFSLFLSSLIAYAVGFFVAPIVKQKRLVFFVCAAFVFSAIRVICWTQFDGTVFYERFVAPITHTITALSIFEFIVVFMKLRYRFSLFILKYFAFIKKKSYEIYLSHQVFMSGIFMVTMFPNSGINLCIIILLTICASWVIYFLSWIFINLPLFKRLTKMEGYGR